MKINNSQDFLYCHTTNNIMRPKQEIFEFYDSAKSNKIGTLVCHKSDIPLRPNYDGSVLAIDFLKVSNKNQGLGTKILKFAEDYSMSSRVYKQKQVCFSNKNKPQHCFQCGGFDL